MLLLLTKALTEQKNQSGRISQNANPFFWGFSIGFVSRMELSLLSCALKQVQMIHGHLGISNRLIAIRDLVKSSLNYLVLCMYNIISLSVKEILVTNIILYRTQASTHKLMWEAVCLCMWVVMMICVYSQLKV